MPIEYTTIGIEPDTHEKLNELKHDEESFDRMLRRLVTER